jgi:hypothetical protein
LPNRCAGPIYLGRFGSRGSGFTRQLTAQPTGWSRPSSRFLSGSRDPAPPYTQAEITFSKGALSMITTPVSSEEAANRQLCTAIRMFFADDDAVAVHTLACAAREIYEKRCGTAGIERMMDHIKESNPLLTQKKIMDILNEPRNFFKHLKNDSVDFSDEMNDFILFTACHDCTMLCTLNQPAEVQAYTIWFLAVNRQLHDAGGALLLTHFPDLKTAARSEQKRAGRWLLDEGRGASSELSRQP